MAEVTHIPFVLTPLHGRPFSADVSLSNDIKPKPVVIFVHGFKGFKDWGCWNLLAGYFAERGFAFIKLNLSHNGTTPDSDDLVDLEAFGNNNFSIEISDLDTLLVYLFSDECAFKNHLDLQNIGIIGHSRGGGLVLIKASEDTRIKAVSTWAAQSNFNPGFGPEVIAKWKKEGVLYELNARTNVQMPLFYQLYEDFAANQKRFNIIEATASLNQSLLIIHGEQDLVVPVTQAYDLQHAQPKALLEVIPGADHAFGSFHPYLETHLPTDLKTAVEKTAEFFHKKLANNG